MTIEWIELAYLPSVFAIIEDLLVINIQKVSIFTKYRLFSTFENEKLRSITFVENNMPVLNVAQLILT